MGKRFEQFTYIRPIFEEIERNFDQAITKFKHAKSIEVQSIEMNQINIIRNNVDTMMNRTI